MATHGFDHGRLGRVLHAAVKGRFVDYRVVDKQRAELDRYLEAVASAKAAALGDELERLAFFVNAYNARVLRAFVAHGLHRNHGRVVDVKGFFDAEKARVAGEELTLNELEEKHIRRLDAHGISADPRAHFVVNCASRDCPPLSAHAFAGKTLAHELEERTRAYLAEPAQVAVDDAGRRIVVAQLFEWYASDFAGPGGVRRFLADFVPALADKLLDESWDLDYRPWDWTSNALT